MRIHGKSKTGSSIPQLIKGVFLTLSPQLNVEWGNMKIYDKDKKLLAIFIKNEDTKVEKNFVTENEQEMQLASFNLKKDKNIKPLSPQTNRTITSTAEVITVIDGSLKINIFDDDLKIVESQIINSGETVALFAGGHGIEVIEKSRFIESKQGPYIEDIDKVRF